jgi:hypothetical protein
VCAFVAVGLLAVELYWFYQLTHPARASQVALPAWLDGLFSFIAGVVWLFLVMIIICAVVWGVMIVALVLDFHGDELGSEVGCMIHAGACCVWGVGAAILTHQRTEFRWWAYVLVGPAVFTVVLVICGLAVGEAERRWKRPAFVTAALAQVDAAVSAGMLVWGLDRPVWLAVALAGAACVGPAAALTVLLSFPRGWRLSNASRI